MVPAYTLPSKLEDYVVMRVVVRQGFSRDMADMLLGDIKNAITELRNWITRLLPVWHRKRTCRWKPKYSTTDAVLIKNKLIYD